VNTQDAAWHPWMLQLLLEIRNIAIDAVSMDKDMLFDNKPNFLAIGKKHKIQKIRVGFSFNRKMVFIVTESLMIANGHGNSHDIFIRD
jgi:hypothetical protein